MGNEHGRPLSDERRAENIRRMDTKMEKRFGRGQSNKVNIVIRGERSTGKTTLVKRLQGAGTQELLNCAPSEAGSVKKAEFQWRFAGDTFEVQVRDVNDKERAKGDSKDVRSEWEAEVYADAHVVILIVNPVKEWTFGYARELLKTMPTHMEVLILANYTDQRTSWTVDPEVMKQYSEKLGDRVHYWEACVPNGFGLAALHPIFKIGLLYEQKQQTLSSLTECREELLTVKQEMKMLAEAQNYDRWLEKVQEEQAAAAAAAAAAGSEEAEGDESGEGAEGGEGANYEDLPATPLGPRMDSEEVGGDDEGLYPQDFDDIGSEVDVQDEPAAPSSYAHLIKDKQPSKKLRKGGNLRSPLGSPATSKDEDGPDMSFLASDVKLDDSFFADEGPAHYYGESLTLDDESSDEDVNPLVNREGLESESDDEPTPAVVQSAAANKGRPPPLKPVGKKKAGGGLDNWLDSASDSAAESGAADSGSSSPAAASSDYGSIDVDSLVASVLPDAASPATATTPAAAVAKPVAAEVHVPLVEPSPQSSPAPSPAPERTRQPSSASSDDGGANPLVSSGFEMPDGMDSDDDKPALPAKKGLKISNVEVGDTLGAELAMISSKGALDDFFEIPKATQQRYGAPDVPEHGAARRSSTEKKKKEKKEKKKKEKKKKDKKKKADSSSDSD